MRRAGSDLAWRELSAAWCEAFGFSPEVDDVGDADNFREVDARNLACIRRAGEAFCGSVAFAAALLAAATAAAASVGADLDAVAAFMPARLVRASSATFQVDLPLLAACQALLMRDAPAERLARRGKAQLRFVPFGGLLGWLFL